MSFEEKNELNDYMSPAIYYTFIKILKGEFKMEAFNIILKNQKG